MRASLRKIQPLFRGCMVVRLIAEVVYLLTGLRDAETDRERGSFIMNGTNR